MCRTGGIWQTLELWRLWKSLHNYQFSFLSEFLNEKYFKDHEINTGFLLSPILFLSIFFFIIDLPVNIRKALENIYADDTTVYESTSNIWNLANDLFAELAPTVQYGNNWILPFVTGDQSLNFSPVPMSGGILNEVRLLVFRFTPDIKLYSHTLLVKIKIKNKYIFFVVDSTIYFSSFEKWK